MSTAHDGKTKGSLFFSFDERGAGRPGGGLRFALDTTEFFCVGKDEVHMLYAI